MSNAADVFKENRCYRCKYYEQSWKCGCKDSPYYMYECSSDFWCDFYECVDKVELERRKKNK